MRFRGLIVSLIIGLLTGFNVNLPGGAMLPKTKAQLKKCMADKSWRMNHLYTIVDEGGIKRPYRQRQVQKDFSASRHGLDVVLKSRQHGFSSETDIDMLDDCYFIPNLQCGIIAHTLNDAQEIFNTKVKLPYDELPKYLRDINPAIKKDGCTLRLANGSSIRVAVSFRSATTHRLHISELGKICAKYPKRAEEIKTGTMPSLHPQFGSKAVIEGTAEGAAGDFYDLCVQSRAETIQAQKEGRELGPLQWRFHFYAWHQDPKNRTEPLGITISDHLKDYFGELAEKSIVTDLEQQAWYAAKKDGPGGLGKLMRQEHPSTVEEAFEAKVSGAVYGDEMEDARSDGRIGFYPWIKDIPVHTFWDLGYRNSTCVGFVQFPRSEIRVIDYYCERGRGATYHAQQVESKPYIYAEHHMPHDVMQHEKGTGQALKDTYQSLFKAPICKVTRPRFKMDSITALSNIFNLIHFNAKMCCVVVDKAPEKNLVTSLAYYRYKWDEDSKSYSKEPMGDFAADPADMMQTLALEYSHGHVGGQRIGSPITIPLNHNKARRKKWNVLSGLRRG